MHSQGYTVKPPHVCDTSNNVSVSGRQSVPGIQVILFPFGSPIPMNCKTFYIFYYCKTWKINGNPKLYSVSFLCVIISI